MHALSCEPPAETLQTQKPGVLALPLLCIMYCSPAMFSRQPCLQKCCVCVYRFYKKRLTDSEAVVLHLHDALLTCADAVCAGAAGACHGAQVAQSTKRCWCWPVQHGQHLLPEQRVAVPCAPAPTWQPVLCKGQQQLPAMCSHVLMDCKQLQISQHSVVLQHKLQQCQQGAPLHQRNALGCAMACLTVAGPVGHCLLIHIAACLAYTVLTRLAWLGHLVSALQQLLCTALAVVLTCRPMAAPAPGTKEVAPAFVACWKVSFSGNCTATEGNSSQSSCTTTC